ncbi:MAG: carbohydrate kinase family protein [Nanoarchaeota archaeon]|nr:carbohydrate kinase family protein [Nanoarchaeota archaeon]
MLDVVTIGTATRDVFITGEEFAVLRDRTFLEKLGFRTEEAECFALGAKMDIERPTMTLGGGAVNTAFTFSRLGFRTGACFKVGKDEFGEGIIRDVKSEKVIPFASFDAKEGTGYSTILLNPNGERTVLAYRGASNTIMKKDIPFSRLKAKWAYVVSGHLSLALLLFVVEQMKREGARVVLAPSAFHIGMGMRKLQPVFRNVSVVLMNREEAARLTSEPYEKEKQIFKALDGAVDGIAVMTDGPKGSLVSDGRYLYRAGVFEEKKLIDRTGAGDAFGAGFISGLMEKNDVSYALRLASANATSVVEEVGARDGILTKKKFGDKRWRYLDLDVEPL